MLGILTIATGEERYINMAKLLAISLIKTDPEIKRAIVTDRPAFEFDGLYDIVIPCRSDVGTGLFHKLYLDQYTPFEETLFIDADSIIIRSIISTISLCRNHAFVVFGDQISSGDWYMDVRAICRRFSLPSIPLFNGGIYYFKDKVIAKKVYEKARELSQNYTSLKLHEFRGSINEEPLISIAMALCGLDAVDDKGKGMRTPIGIIGKLNIDVLNHQCSFQKENELTEPAIMHFAGSYADAFHYCREKTKLLLWWYCRPVPTWLLSFFVNITFNSVYGTFVFFKRVAKVILKRKKLEFNNYLPVFSSQ